MLMQQRLIKYLLPCVLLTNLASAIAKDVRVTDWLELMPETDQKALEAMPAINHTPIPKFDEQGNLVFDEPPVLSSTKTVAEMANKNIKIAGFVVPVEFTDDMLITEFFLVPYFGACIHVPPPPPNQIIYVKYKKGLKTDIIADPFLVSGKLLIENINHDIAQSSYSMLANKVEVYKE